MSDISVVTATMPGREELLKRAIASVESQTQRPAAHHIAIDEGHDSPHLAEAVTRNAALERVDTDWVAFLDDDDVFYPKHCQLLRETAEATGADLVYPWFDTQPPGLLLWHDVEGRPFEEVGTFGGWYQMFEVGNFIPVTYLVKTEFVRKVGGFPLPESDRWPHKTCVDWGMHRDMLMAGAKYVHLPQHTWCWYPSEARARQ